MTFMDNHYYVNWVARLIADDWDDDFEHNCHSLDTLAELLHTYNYDVFDIDTAFDFLIAWQDYIIEQLDEMGFDCNFELCEEQPYDSYFQTWKRED